MIIWPSEEVPAGCSEQDHLNKQDQGARCFCRVGQLSCFLQVLSHLMHVMTEAILRNLMIALSTVSIPSQSHTTIYGYLLLGWGEGRPHLEL